jgi:hypothetical protein
MGLFSTLGKIVGGVVSLVPGVGSLVGGIIAKGGQLLDAKKSMNRVAPLPVAVRDASRLISSMGSTGFGMNAMPVLRTSMAKMRASPVLPGGAVAGRFGPQAQTGSALPASFGGTGSQKRRHAKRSRRRATAAKRRAPRKKLRFGSPAWRKKYMRR